MEALDLIVKKLDNIEEKLDAHIDKGHKLDTRVVRLESKAKYIYTMCLAFITAAGTYLKTKFFGS